MIFRFNDFRSGHYKEWLGRFQVAQYSVAFRDMHHVNNVWRECASRFEARLQVVETSVENTEKKWCWINELFGHMNMYGAIYGHLLPAHARADTIRGSDLSILNATSYTSYDSLDA